MSLGDTNVVYLYPSISEPNVLFAAVMPNPRVTPILRSDDYGENWRLVIPADSLAGPGCISEDPFNPGHFVCAGLGTFLASTDNGNTWNRRVTNLQILPYVGVVAVYSGIGPGVMILMADDVDWHYPLHRSVDGGYAFTPIPDEYPGFGPLNLYSFPSHPNDIWLGGTGRLSTDGGMTWAAPDDTLNEFWTIRSGQLPEMTYYSVLRRLQGPHVGEPFLAARSSDDTRWSLIRSVAGAGARLAAHPANQDELVMDDTTGLLLTLDGGETWSVFGEFEIDSLRTRDLAFSSDGRYLYRAMGRGPWPDRGGIWRKDLSETAQYPRRMRTSEDLSLYPNPTNGVATVWWPAADAGRRRLQLYDLVGRRIVDTELNATQHYLLPTFGLPSGSYIVVVKDGVRRASRRLSIIR
ncbi:T9SS type A sorting domain-containing protein [candidate division KSB1 bacterium]|nr:T9SS type A sorting domain-containing protein [candidate division KSB1 bacterium]